MSISATAVSQLTVVETLTDDVPFAPGASITHNGLNTTAKLSATTTPAGAEVAAIAVPLVAGAATIDLTAMAGTNALAVNGTGLQIQAVKIQNPAGNEHPLLVTPADSDGYPLFGFSGNLMLNPGEELLWIGDGALSTIGPALKKLTLSDGGAGGTETHNFIFVLG